MDRLLQRLDAEVRDEIRFYLEARAQEFVDGGMEPGAAWKAALEACGDVGKIEVEVHGQNTDSQSGLHYCGPADTRSGDRGQHGHLQSGARNAVPCSDW